MAKRRKRPTKDSEMIELQEELAEKIATMLPQGMTFYIHLGVDKLKTSITNIGRSELPKLLRRIAESFDAKNNPGGEGDSDGDRDLRPPEIPQPENVHLHYVDGQPQHSDGG